jgi:hypothetical protein
MKNYLLLLAAVFTFALTSCDSKEDDAPAVKTKVQLLTANKWIITAETVTDTDSSGTTTTDNYASFQACEKDNTVFFATDFTVTFNEEANVCAGQPQTTSSTWTFANNETQIILGSGAPPGDLLELTSSKMVIQSTFSFGGITSVTTTTFAPQ